MGAALVVLSLNPHKNDVNTHKIDAHYKILLFGSKDEY